MQNEVAKALQQAKQDLAYLATHPLPLLRPVILLHGYHSQPTTWQEWLWLLDQASTNGKQWVFAPDLGQDYSIPELAAAIAPEIRSRYDGPVDMIGHSLGSLVAVELATAVHRYGVAIERIYALATPFRGTILGFLGFLPGVPLPKQLQAMTPHNPYLAHLRHQSHHYTGRIATFYMLGDGAVSRTSAEAVGHEHHCYHPGRWVLPATAHRLAHRDPRIIRDVMVKLQKRESVG